MPSSHLVLSAIAGAALDAVVATNRADEIVHWNALAEQTFGWTAREAVGQRLHQLIIPPSERQRHLDGLARFNATGEIRVLGRRIEVAALRRDGSQIPIELAVMIAPQTGGDVFVAFLRDLTPQREAEREIAGLQSEIVHLSRVNAMSTMAAVLAHELNQPLTAAASFLASARRLRDHPLEDGPTAWEAVESAEKAVHRAGDTIRSIRQMIGKGSDGREQVPVAHLVAETSRLMGSSLRVQPTVRVAKDATCALVSRIQVEQVLLNLLRNADEAVAGVPGGAIEISARSVPGQVQITVTDNGPGIAPEMRDRLFSTVASRKEAGMGIGLSVCRTIVEQHDGKIWHHAADGRTSFSFTVPRGR
jgi:two-component system sensor kinase FixL